MDVEVVRSGGIAGLRLSWTVNVEDQPDPEEWVLLIERLPWSEASPAPLEPDRYVYRIRCEPHEATLAERQVTGPWRDLVERVRDVAEPERAPGGRSTSGPRRPRRGQAPPDRRDWGVPTPRRVRSR